jgi:hypothetical protein
MKGNRSPSTHPPPLLLTSLNPEHVGPLALQYKLHCKVVVTPEVNLSISISKTFYEHFFLQKY